MDSDNNGDGDETAGPRIRGVLRQWRKYVCVSQSSRQRNMKYRRIGEPLAQKRVFFKLRQFIRRIHLLTGAHTLTHTHTYTHTLTHTHTYTHTLTHTHLHTHTLTHTHTYTHTHLHTHTYTLTLGLVRADGMYMRLLWKRLCTVVKRRKYARTFVRP